MIRAAVLDFGGVLTTSPFEGIHLYEAELGVAHGSLVQLIAGRPGEDAPWHKVERGELAAADFWAEVSARGRNELGVELSLGDFMGAFGRTFQVRPRMVELVRELRGSIALGLLTNNVAELRAVWTALVPVEELFDVVVDSSQVGLRKPDPRIFRLALEQLGARAAETVFVDDMIEHVEAASALGMVGIHFRDEDEVMARLRELARREGEACVAR